MDDKTFGAYLAKQDQKRLDAVEDFLKTLTEKEQRLVRDAAVMGFVLGTQAGHLSRKDFPRDSQIIVNVITSCHDMSHLYPTIGEYMEAEDDE